METTFSEEKFKETIVYTLGNFIYRYIETKASGTVEVKNESEKLFYGRALELSMKEALKCQDQLARQGMMEHIRQLPKGEKFSVLYEISCRILKLQEDGSGQVEVRALMNWDSPHHSSPAADNSASSARLMTQKSQIITFDHYAQFKKLFPLGLESVCEIF